MGAETIGLILLTTAIASIPFIVGAGDDGEKPQPVSQDIGTVTEEEAVKSASRTAMRASTYFTSPTGVLGDAPKRGARLTGA